MKKISLLLVFIISFLSFSCSDNDDKSIEIIPVLPILTEIKYVVLSDTEVITDIKYKNADGTLENGILSTVPSNQWSVTVMVAKPFNARLEADFENAASSPVSGIVKIFVDGTLAIQQGILVPGNGNLEQDLEYLAE